MTDQNRGQSKGLTLTPIATAMRSASCALQGGSVPTALPKISMDQEIHLKVLRHIEANPEITQRELAQELGVSLGKANYCLRSLIEKGLIKARNFKNSNNKAAYAYLLTPTGIERKAQITMRFLKRKLSEYEDLKTEIEILQREVENQRELDR